MNEDTKKVEELMLLMKKYFVDEVQIGDITIKKSIHLNETKVQQTKEKVEEDPDLLFYSSEG